MVLKIVCSKLGCKCEFHQFLNNLVRAKILAPSTDTGNLLLFSVTNDLTPIAGQPVCTEEKVNLVSIESVSVQIELFQ